MLARTLQLLRIRGLLLVFSFSSGWASAEPVTTIRDSGDPANRVDVVVLGDGYTASEMAQFAVDAESAVNGLFDQEPFREYQDYFNAHRIEVTSNESGADHPESGVFVDTALDATYNCGGVQRVICVDVSEVNLIVAASVNPDQRDIILVIVNDPQYGGSGGAIAVASSHSAVVQLVLHELGHSFGLLADEYDSSPPACVNTVEPWEQNVTLETQRDLIKWNTGGGPPTGWIEFSTAIPTTTTLPETPGLYEGARYCTTGLFRPTHNSKMRSVGLPFEQINEEQLVQRIYNLVSPLDSSSPTASSIVIPKGANQSFTVEVPTPSSHFLTADWYVDEAFQTSGYDFTLETGFLTTGLHTVDVVINDPTVKVRQDPAKVLTETRRWNIDIAGEDSDGDGISDEQDNCVQVPNGPLIPDAGGNIQMDTDDDGYGNLCDGDLNNDGDTNTLDLNLYKQVHRSGVGDANYNVDADFNGDGEINTLDLNIYRGLHRKPPGPSCCGLF